MSVMIQKVAYSETRGVFLGIRDGASVWSKDPGLTGKELAPAFQDRDDLAKYLERELKDKAVFIAEAAILVCCRLQEVWPRQEGGMAGVEDIANSGLPRWGQ